MKGELKVDFKFPKILKELETQINSSYKLPIFKGYIAINKRGIEKLIDEIYETLPIDLMEARNYLKSRNYNIQNITNENQKKETYGHLKKLENNLLYSPLQLANFVIINIKQAEKLIDKVNNSIPQEIIEAKKLSK